MNQTLNHISYNPRELRDKLLVIVRNNLRVYRTLRKHINLTDQASVFAYYYRTSMTILLILDQIWKDGLNKDDETLLPRIMESDTKGYSMEAVLACWLTLDHWRLEVEFPNLIEDSLDISYGLVGQYSNAILRGAAYFVGLSEAKEASEGISVDMHERALSSATTSYLTHFPYLPELLG